MSDLHNAQLAFELHADVLQRACGRGGAPVDVERARSEIDAAEATLRALRVALERTGRDA